MGLLCQVLKKLDSFCLQLTVFAFVVRQNAYKGNYWRDHDKHQQNKGVLGRGGAVLVARGTVGRAYTSGGRTRKDGHLKSTDRTTG